ncbi:PD40 domain-containing protein [Sulfuriroseicoccus oceanibius]|uniref:PD40 domain-containing protein n=1 Tax=Sulfuriroseicoccus oceanibius TaxID=2707525 RepID=A0A6B3L0W2_9BACT|nr:PD40 domain-containing protein [Sulfuriroseicoccus oceanibius]QQL44253.1 PD40 domain-containing protein [Sulfuriroseicoccus oceanibius]
MPRPPLLIRSFRAVTLVVLSLLMVALPDADAQVVIKKSSQINVDVERFGGPNGSSAAAVVQQDLKATPGFRLAKVAGSTWTVKGVVQDNALQGSLIDPTGRARFSRRYTAPSLATAAHQLSGDVIYEITGTRGLPGSKIVFSGSAGRGREIFICDWDGKNLKQLTSDGSLAVSPAISPDGRKVAFTSYRSGYPDVWVLDLPTARRQRAYNSPGTNTGAAFSPDGRRIALTMSFSGNPELYVGPATGGRARQLTKTIEVESSPSWSPDGRQVAYVTSRGAGPRIAIVSAGGGRPKILNTGHGYNTEPSWSPDGKQIAFNVRGSGGMQIAVYEISTGRTRIVGSGEAPHWGPDSQHVVATKGGDLVLINTADGSTRTIVKGRRAKEPSWTIR